MNPVIVDLSKCSGLEAEINPNDLLIGIDFLKDNYTLMNVPINDSPHYRLVEAINANKDYLGTDYISRMIHGYLDERKEIIGYLKSDYFVDSFLKCKKALLQDSYKPVVIFIINGNNYILDGKHTAATATLLGIEKIRCKVVGSDVLRNCFPLKERKLIKDKADYSKHALLFKGIGL